MLRKKAKNIAETMLRDYPHIDAYIKERTLELTYPIASDDENVGGGKGSHISKPQEQLIITIDEDKRLNSLKKEKEAIDDALDYCDEITMKVVEEYFWKKHREKTMDGIANEVSLNKVNIYKRLNKLYERILKNRGLLEFIG